MNIVEKSKEIIKLQYKIDSCKRALESDIEYFCTAKWSKCFHKYLYYSLPKELNEDIKTVIKNHINKLEFKLKSYE